MSEPQIKTLNPCSRMALVVRGWGLEGALALPLFVLWELAVALDGEGLGILVPGLLGIVVWRNAAVRRRLATTTVVTTSRCGKPTCPPSRSIGFGFVIVRPSFSRSAFSHKS